MSGASQHSSPEEEAVRAALEPLRAASHQAVPAELSARHIAAMVALGNEVAAAQQSQHRAVTAWAPRIMRQLHFQRRAVMSAGIATAACALFAVIALGTVSNPARTSVEGLSIADLPAATAVVEDGRSLDGGGEARSTKSANRSRSSRTSSARPSWRSSAPAERAQPGAAPATPSKHRAPKRGASVRPESAVAPVTDTKTNPAPSSGSNGGTKVETSAPVAGGDESVNPGSGGTGSDTNGSECPAPDTQPGTPSMGDGSAEMSVEPHEVHAEAVTSPPAVIVGNEPGATCGGQP